MKLLVNLDVPRLEPAINFYTRALGLKLNRVIDGDVAELGGASSEIYLLQQAEGSEAVDTGIARRYGRHWTPVHLDFVVEDLEAAVERATRAGATPETGPCHWRGATHVSFADPFGHGFCLINFEGDGYRSGDLPPSPRNG